jgi:hypothetical protein
MAMSKKMVPGRPANGEAPKRVLDQSVRFDEETFPKIERAREMLGITRAEFVRQCVDIVLRILEGDDVEHITQYMKASIKDSEEKEGKRIERNKNEQNETSSQ